MTIAFVFPDAASRRAFRRDETRFAGQPAQLFTAHPNTRSFYGRRFTMIVDCRADGDLDPAFDRFVEDNLATRLLPGGQIVRL